MVSYTTRDEFRKFASEISVNERVMLRKSAEERGVRGATFLSHSSKDEDLLVGAIRILENHGGQVYIDKKDGGLPPYTSKSTAKALKARIEQTRRFVLLASVNSKESRWVPWELGIADQAKGLGSVAVFPAVESASDTTWTKWEYLGLYRRIVWGKLEGFQNNVWMVWDHDTDSATYLGDWLRS